jgi:hypothetical protein
MSPYHNANVALVMNINSSHVSPPYHVKFDKRFQTLSQQDFDTQWQKHTYFENNTTAPNTKDSQHPDPMLERAVDQPLEADNNACTNKHPRVVTD